MYLQLHDETTNPQNFSILNEMALVLQNQYTGGTKDVAHQLLQFTEYNLFLEEVKQQEKLESLSRLKNKNKFWRDLFSENSFTLREDQLRISESIKSSFSNFNKPSHSPSFDLDTQNKIIDDCVNSHVRGYDSLSYSLLKNGSTSDLRTTIKYKKVLTDKNYQPL
ncbi:hypothetical protein BpHYR1_012607 [Brachionus plicatilis]|uniref:Uncharacterized protein n=1 Tax=Brachionus plicatilis TaxID=10195 RepID=A0A3M7QR31_BRAPC|nr:hypothetical protein BpHYR1_012607 [Brachionus plicatilis]